MLDAEFSVFLGFMSRFGMHVAEAQLANQKPEPEHSNLFEIVLNPRMEHTVEVKGLRTRFWV